MTFQNFYVYISQASSLIPVIAGISYYKAQTRPFRILFYFFVLAVLAEIQASVAIKLWHNNMPGLHIYTVLEFIAFSMLFYLHAPKNNIMRLLIMVNTLVFLIIASLSALWLDGILLPNDLSRGYSSASLILYTLVYLYYLFSIDDIRYMWEYPMCWICIGTLIYFASNYPYFSEKNLLISRNLNIEWALHLLHAAVNIIACCLYAQSFRWLAKQKATKL